LYTSCNPLTHHRIAVEVCILPKMAEDPVPGHQAFWAKKRASLQSEFPAFIEKYPDTDTNAGNY
jgi:hypothetical protein